MAEGTPTIVEFAPAGKGQRYRIVLSDGRELRFSAEACRKTGIGVDSELSDDVIGELERIERDVAVHDAALRLLSHRSRSASEMRTRLSMRGFDEGVVEHEIDRLEQSGLLDDAAFARSWVADRQLHAPRGRLLLRYELLSKGVPPEDVEKATAPIDDTEVAEDLAKRRGRKLGEVDDDTYRKKVLAHLNRRGFSYETARAAVEEALAARRSDAAGG